MDADWSNPVVRYYEGRYAKSPEQQDVIMEVAALRDLRICPAIIHCYDDYTLHVYMPRLNAKPVEDCWEDIDLPQLKEWCEDLYEDLALLGIVAYDITSGNVMYDGTDFMLVDYEQFKPYTDELYERRKQWMLKQIHQLGDTIKCRVN